MSKTIHITESQMKMLMGEMAYPTSFNFDEFRQLKTFAERIRYCEARLKRLSSGSSRIVYVVDEDKVLKLAKNQKGLAQNKNEIRLGTEIYYTCFAEIYEYDEDGLWVEMQYCRKAKKTDFKSIYGVPFEALCCAMYNMCGGRFNPFSDYQPIVDEIWQRDENDTLDFFNSIHEYIVNEGLSHPGDLLRINSWGVTFEGYFVLVDYGFNDDVYKRYYAKRR